MQKKGPHGPFFMSSDVVDQASPNTRLKIVSTCLVW